MALVIIPIDTTALVITLFREMADGRRRPRTLLMALS